MPRAESNGAGSGESAAPITATPAAPAAKQAEALPAFTPPSAYHAGRGRAARAAVRAADPSAERPLRGSKIGESNSASRTASTAAEGSWQPRESATPDPR